MSPGLALLSLTALLAAPTSGPAPLLIGPKLLKGLLARATVLDARDAQKFEAGHLPGAISLPWVDLAQMPKSPLARPPEAMAALLSTKGVRSDAWVVIYGAGRDGFGEEGRLFWTLSYLGHSRLSVLDGGLPAWVGAGLEVSTEGPAPPAGKFQAEVNAAVRVDKAAVRAALAKGEVKVLDVREADEFTGAKKYGEPRGGHIPGAINLPWKQLMRDDGTALPRSQLLKLLQARGLSPSDAVIVYCTGGVRSGFAFLALKAAGFKSVANYDGSFWEWSSDSALPVEPR
jgi:thiosulfate/3-mercaptopyruvate sulfurtransferase